MAAQARAIVMDVERRLGFDPTDRETEKLGYDVESRILTQVHYLRRSFQREPDFSVTSVNYDLSELLSRGEAPR